MRVAKTELPGVLHVQNDVHTDPRGSFMESWNARDFSNAGFDNEFVQDNFTRSSRNTLRGLHYQLHQPQGKLVRALQGRIFDVAVDLRRASATYLRWLGMELTEDSGDALWIPPGFAHGFLVLSDTASVAYKCSDYYAPEHEHSIVWNDPTLAISWPLADGQTPLLSKRDAGAPPLREDSTFA